MGCHCAANWLNLAKLLVPEISVNQVIEFLLKHFVANFLLTLSDNFGF